MPIGIIIVVVQILLVVHVLRTGRDFRWIFLLVFLPGIGAIIYFVMEIMPSLGGGLRTKRVMRRAGRVVDPGRDARRLRLDYERNRSVETATRLAAELIREGKADEAIEICESARAGLFEHDPTVLLTLASAYFSKRQFSDAIATLDLLREKNPEFRSPEGHLLYARALEEGGATGRAVEEYEALSRYYPGAEARVRLAQLQRALGNEAAAAHMFRSIVEEARLAPKHFQKAQREWIEIAKKALG